MNECELTASITAIANGFACKLTSDEMLLLYSILVQLGDTLVTITTHRDFCQK